MEALQRVLEKMKFSEHTCRERTPEEWEQVRADNFNSSEGNLHLEDEYTCEICKNKGLVMKPVEIRQGYWSTTSSECKSMGVRRTIRRMYKSGLKNIIRDYTFQHFKAEQEWQKTIKTAAMEYARNPEGWFFVGGQSGSGKSHICTAICREFLLGGQAVKYMLWRDEVVKIKAVVNDSEQYESLISAYKQAPVLYIDDLFKTGKNDKGERQQPTGGDVNVAFEILNFRYNDPKLLTIISTECTMADILNIDEAVGGRIFERAKKAFSLKSDKSKNYRLRGVVEL